MSSIRIQRDARFWAEIAAHPAVVELMGRAFTYDEIASVMSHPSVLPIASEHGGYWFAALDTSGRVCELHTLFSPAGWGREAHKLAKEAFNHVFGGACVAIITNQMEANPKSQPPLSFGFRPLGGFEPSPFGSAKTWLLTREMWLVSPGGRRSCH